MANYSKADIERGLRELPSLIARKAEELSIAIEKLDFAKQELRIAEAKVLISLGAKDLTVDMKKAQVALATQEQAAAVITADTEMRIAKIKMEELRDSFDSVRKAANLIIEEMKSI